MLKRFINTILDFLFPIYCVGCKKENFHLCKDCLGKLPVKIIENHVDGLTVFAVIKFKEGSPVAQLIHRFKYDGAKEIAEIFGMLLKNVKLPPTFLIPVPLHDRRRNFRGFNQSLLLAQELSKKWNLPIADILQRHRYTRPQVELGGVERLTNVTDAFSMKNPEEKLNPSATYTIIDDVCTTGSTINECAKALKKHGAEKVFAMVVAKT